MLARAAQVQAQVLAQAAQVRAQTWVQARVRGSGLLFLRAPPRAPSLRACLTQAQAEALALALA